MKNRILSIFAAIAVTLSLSACQNGDTEQTATLSDSSVNEAATQESVKLPHGYENATVVDDETMDFWRSILSIKGEQITFPCTYTELDSALSKHGITIKPFECWSDDNPDDRDVCFMDLYDGDTYFMALTGTCVSEDDLESYIFDGTTVTQMAQKHISIDGNKIGDELSNINYDDLANETYRGNTSITYIINDENYEIIISFRSNEENNIISGFSICVNEK